MEYIKPPLSINQQINLLLSRGLKIEDRDLASHILSNISYYRLRAYWLPLETSNNTKHIFKQGASFKQALDNYIFDRKLRLLVFDEIERIEVAFRTQLIHRYSMNHGGDWYFDENNFKNPNRFGGFKKLLESEYKKSSETFISHYKTIYTHPALPPAWVMLELTSFGMLSGLYKNLKTSDSKKEVTSHFGVHYKVLESWLESLSNLRNLCAHHGRIWNRKFVKEPIYPKKTKGEWVSINIGNQHRNKLYLQLCIIKYLLNFVNPNSSFTTKLKKLLEEFTNIPVHYMGFPEKWATDTFWK